MSEISPRSSTISGCFSILRITASRRINSANFGFNDVFTALNRDFESNENRTTDESPVPIRNGTHLTVDKVAMMGIVVEDFNPSKELSLSDVSN
jgi:hypothetical protein